MNFVSFFICTNDEKICPYWNKTDKIWNIHYQCYLGWSAEVESIISGLALYVFQAADISEELCVFSRVTAVHARVCS